MRLCLPLLLLAIGVAARAEDSQSGYLRDVKPILEQRCYACHGPVRQRAGLRLDTVASILEGSDKGEVVAPGKSAQSRLIAVLTEDKSGRRMPPKTEGSALSATEIAKIQTWIDAGAQAPEKDEPAKDPREHWAFHKPKPSPIPRPNRPGWETNPIDAFLAAEHERRGLRPVPPAPKSILLRRVYLDLIGLPPTPADLEAFVMDSAPDAYERVVDRLLASPQYGERWARHWMDVWRYSDWSGFGKEIRNSQFHIWRWRDWIVESLNRDRGYDQMVLSMLAADEIDALDADGLRATGFLARSYYKFNRNTWLEATVEHTSKAFLGITFNCARCHEHKYDPISHADYYRFRAFFEPYDVRLDRVAGETNVLKDGLARVYDARPEASTYLFNRGNDLDADKSRALTPAIPAAFGGPEVSIQPVNLPPRAYYPALDRGVQRELLAKARDAVAAAEKAAADKEQRIASLKAAAARLAIGSQSVAAPGSDSDRGKTTALINDSFRSARPELWETGAGEWSFEGGRLVQKLAGATEKRLIAKAAIPRDFALRFRFRITGGEMWKSIGFTFDRVDDGNNSSVYLSAVEGGQKLQVSHAEAGSQTYPATGMTAFPTELNRDYVLGLDVRDRLMNVTLDGKLLLVYTMPRPRQTGKLALWMFDATGEFKSIRLESLPESITLATKLEKGEPIPTTVDEAKDMQKAVERELAIAWKQVSLARAERASTEARLAADSARYASHTARFSNELIISAVHADRAAAAAKAEVDLEKARIDLETNANAKAEFEKAEKKLAEARAAAASNEGDYSPVGVVYPKQSTGRRLAMAKWIIDPNNPLTARVAVNHIWLRHFGKPLVPTVFDFGLNGKSPTHPKLLDWLAVNFVEQGWSMKQLHRLMVTSSAYRMQSWHDGGFESNVAADQDNLMLWRMNPRRAESEVIRDAVLRVANRLDLRMGGPELDETAALATNRRSLYYRHAAEKQATFFLIFDAASVNECYARSTSIVPHQALALANSPIAVAQSRLLASDIEREIAARNGASDAAFIRAAYLRILNQIPSPEEESACGEFLAAQTSRLADATNLTAFSAGSNPEVKPAGDPRMRARENLVLVLINHNEFVTIR